MDGIFVPNISFGMPIVKAIRKMTADNPLHNLLINLSTDLMLRASDLLKLKVSDVMFENGKVRETVKVKQ